MKRIWVTEHERLYRGEVGSESARRPDGRVELAPEHFERLQRFDEALSGSEGTQVFDWRLRYAKATQWVGVVQVRGLSVEILPKIEEPPDHEGGREDFARKNLLYMLSLAGGLPIRERDVASQAVYTAPLIEAMIRIFAERLFEELNRGMERGYVRREANLHVLRGKLRFADHVRHNCARRERMFVAFDEFLADTLMNRIFRAACRALLGVSRVPATQERLSYCLMVLDDVTDIDIRADHFDQVFLNRQNERFREVLNFCRLVLLGQSPAAATGGTTTFSLLFDMNIVFETFVAELMRRYVLKDDLAPWRVFPQSKSKTRHLVFRPRHDIVDAYDPERHGRGTYPLKADLLFEGPAGQLLVVDTKWKRLSDARSRQGVSRNDLLQLYAYATRYGSSSNVLLYPRVDDLTEEQFHLPLGSHGLQSIAVRFVELRRDLRRDRDELVAELREILQPCETSGIT